MTNREALQALLDGKRVRHSEHTQTTWIEFKRNLFWYENGKQALGIIPARMDWQIVEDSEAAEIEKLSRKV